MAETFLILLSGGVMLAAAISDPREVILRWLRLAGIIALCMAGLAMYFATSGGPRGGIALTIAFVLAQLAFVQIAWRATQRLLSVLAAACAIATATLLLHQLGRGTPIVLAIASFFSAAVVGFALMDMLLGHAYLNAAEMTMRPFLRLNRALAAAMLGRAILSIGGTIVIQYLRPVEMFWTVNLVYIATRWLVGFGVAGVFVFMAHDCIKRRATQSATGILYVADVLIFIGEMIGLWLMSQTGMPL